MRTRISTQQQVAWEMMRTLAAKGAAQQVCALHATTAGVGRGLGPGWHLADLASSIPLGDHGTLQRSAAMPQWGSDA